MDKKIKCVIKDIYVYRKELDKHKFYCGDIYIDSSKFIYIVYDTIEVTKQLSAIGALMVEGQELKGTIESIKIRNAKFREIYYGMKIDELKSIAIETVEIEIDNIDEFEVVNDNIKIQTNNKTKAFNFNYITISDTEKSFLSNIKNEESIYNQSEDEFGLYIETMSPKKLIKNIIENKEFSKSLFNTDIIQNKKYMKAFSLCLLRQKADVLIKLLLLINEFPIEYKTSIIENATTLYKKLKNDMLSSVIFIIVLFCGLGVCCGFMINNYYMWPIIVGVVSIILIAYNFSLYNATKKVKVVLSNFLNK